ncbi:CLUMA_CG011586, isoform A [Clunio marinus]|uniref:CLUMA_CG011586, isoform A n=1 Tax=Clunio marinus TaxID=568069 RepID=A0A1J1ID58_9DIPT|nr:CLUMA_CG011586, isoform A [Clunio marinus]
MHINPGSMKANLIDIQSIVANTNLHAVAVSETWFNEKHNDNLISLTNFTLIRHDRKNKRGGGVALYLRPGINYKIITKSHPNSFSEYLFIEVFPNSDKSFALGVVYNPPANTKIEPLKRCLSNISNCLIMGDFNINFLNSSSMTTRFRSFLSSIDLCCINSTETNFVKGKTPTQIDLLIAKNKSFIKTFSQLPLDKVAPLRSIEIKPNNKPSWLTRELENLMNARDFYHNIYYSEKNLHLQSKYYNTFKKLRNKVNALKRKLKMKKARSLLDPNLPPKLSAQIH